VLWLYREEAATSMEGGRETCSHTLHRTSHCISFSTAQYEINNKRECYSTDKMLRLSGHSVSAAEIANCHNSDSCHLVWSMDSGHSVY